MFSIETALAVDFARRGAMVIFVVLLTIIALPLWIFAALGFDGAIDFSSREAVALHVTLTLVMGFGAAISVVQAHGRIARFFLQPITATRLVACQMMLGMVTIAAMYVVAVSLLNLRGVHWPILGPALFLATALACTLAVMWAFEGNTLAQLIGCTATSVPLVIWFSRCYGARIMGDWKTMWDQPTAIEALTLAGIVSGAFVVAVIGVTRSRRGDHWDFTALQACWEQIWMSRRTATTFSSPMAAQCWSEWRQKFGPAPTCLIGCFILFMATIRLAGLIDTPAMLEVIVVIPLVVLTVILPLIYGLLLSNSAHGSGWREMRHTLATRPVTNQFIASTILRNGASVLLWAWSSWLFGLLVVAGLCFLAGYDEEVVRVLLPQPIDYRKAALASITIPLLSWIFTTLLATLVATGRPWLCVALPGCLMFITLVVMLLAQVVPLPIYMQIINGWLLGSGTLFLAVTVTALILAARKQMIVTRTIVTAVAAWLLTAIAFGWLSPDFSMQSLVWLWHGIGFLSLGIFPLAALPLAIRWNRHR